MNIVSLLYTRTRLWFDGRHGQAQCDGVERNLMRSPKVLATAPVEIDYCPELDEYEIRPLAWDRKRDMEPPEREAAKRWLARFAAAIKRRLARSHP